MARYSVFKEQSRSQGIKKPPLELLEAVTSVSPAAALTSDPSNADYIAPVLLLSKCEKPHLANLLDKPVTP